MKSSAKWQGKYVHTWHSFLQGGWEIPKVGHVAWIIPYKCTHWGGFFWKRPRIGLLLCQLQEAAPAKFWLLCWMSLFSLLPVESRSFWCGKCSSLAGMSGFSFLFLQFSSVLLNEPSLMCDRANHLLSDSFLHFEGLICLPYLTSLFLSFLFLCFSLSYFLSSTSQTHLVRSLHVLKFI